MSQIFKFTASLPGYYWYNHQSKMLLSLHLFFYPHQTPSVALTILPTFDFPFVSKIAFCQHNEDEK